MNFRRRWSPPAAASFPPLKIKEINMSAYLAFLVPIGTVLAWADGQPRPPERHRKKLSAWKTNNSSGRLIRKQDERGAGNIILPPSFMLHEVDCGGGGVIAIRIHRTFTLETSLMFTIIERPAVGSCRVFDRPGDSAELVHLAAKHEYAEEPS
uniref:Tiorf51 protein n=2 Tax=Agrobacterium tumefaciens TaxID=358 RepID=Q9R6K8_AGRTU|nr:tiorf51 [Agrobacterium tumefaciens]